MTDEQGGDLGEVLRYHEQTKHRLDRYARALGYMDWATQPDPFRTFQGAETTRLDLTEIEEQPSYDDLFEPGRIEPAPPSPEAIGRLLQDSMALSCWKEVPGSRWALRVNPSSGNLHPTEAYLLLGPGAAPGDAPGLFHYHSHGHELERRREISAPAWDELVKGLTPGSLFLGLTSIHWRESWKYGERAYRYCQLDVGHALAAVSLAAAGLGWSVRPCPAPGDGELARLLAVEGQAGPEAEHPDLLLRIEPGPATGDWRFPLDGLEDLCAGEVSGEANVLSRDHHDWPILDEVARAAVRASGEGAAGEAGPDAAPWIFPEKHHAARQLFRQRRSAVSMDGRARISREAFASVLERLVPRPGRPPFEALPGGPHVHPVFLVHRVDGVTPGAYLLARRPGVERFFEEATGRESGSLERAVLPGHAELFRIREGLMQAPARQVSCHQDIASDGVFAVAMLAEFDRGMERHGPWYYRHMHWEAGALGQVLYLEAEALGIRGTGIGCFFDDALHRLLGLEGRAFQTLYHFTVGGPVDDPRIRVGDPYAHLAGA